MNFKKTIITVDKLGKEFVISRNIKQIIFNKRRDLTDEMKAEIYVKLQKENEEIENKLRGKF